ncbi:hypothetical protein M0802_003738 [Mischocyttarus mexicanus]|nr:hypothetical protein M0802_003738 [Mischocyttarus mexicanus]
MWIKIESQSGSGGSGGSGGSSDGVGVGVSGGGSGGVGDGGGGGGFATAAIAIAIAIGGNLHYRYYEASIKNRIKLSKLPRAFIHPYEKKTQQCLSKTINSSTPSRDTKEEDYLAQDKVDIILLRI